jgi:YD repeat-containing protein
MPEELDSSRLPSGAAVDDAVQKAQREEEEWEAWLKSPEAAQEREESRFAFAHLDRGGAEELLRTVFAEQLAQLNRDPARFLSDAKLLSTSEPTSATVKDDGDSLLLESSLPVKAEDEQGDLRKVDLSLEGTDAGFEPENALVEVRIPESADRPIEVGDQGVAIKLAGADEQSLTRPFGDENTFAAEVLPDTDMLVSPIATGVELFNLLRSEDSPETFRFEVEMPAGAELRANDDWGAKVVEGDELLAMIPEPVAVDAQGTDVPVEMTLEGNSLVLQVNHREGDYAMPILLDPILENDELWIYGQNLDTMGHWTNVRNDTRFVHSTWCIFTCFGPSGSSTRGLYISSQPSWYGSNIDAHWAYGAPNIHSYISSVTLGAPYVREDHGCPDASYKQPHDYFGVWSRQGFWVQFSTRSANFPGGHYTLPSSGDAAIFGLNTANANNYGIGCPRDLYAGGAHVWLDDWGKPVIDSVSGIPSGWISSTTPVNVTAQVRDEGLGVQNAVIWGEGSLTVYDLPTQSQCSGTKRSLCWTSYTASFADNGITGASFREGQRLGYVNAYDATGKYAGASWFELKVDGTAPEVTLDGQLAEATEEDLGPVMGGADVEQLSLPAYNLEIEAKDGSNENGTTMRSGVKEIEVYLDGVEQEVPWSPAQSCTSSCPMTQTYQLKLSKLNTSGPHKLKVNVRDFVGNVRERDIEFEYFPATGMKDEYVMQYFPLDDGSGNEAAEEHPERPELAVNVMNGNLVYRETDIDVEGSAALDLEVERYYNSMLPTAENSEWGDGWTLAQTPEIDSLKPAVVPVKAELLDETGLIEGNVALPTAAGQSKFDPALQATITKTGGGGYQLADETGESAGTIAFDANGQTEALLGEGFAKVDYDYEAGKLSEIEVSDPATFSADPSELVIPEPEEIAAPTYASTFGSKGSADGQLQYPIDAAADSQGNVWILDYANNRVQKFDANGKFLAKVGASGTGNGQLSMPTGIALAANGDLLVADAGNSRVQRFSSSGAFISKFGSLGSGNGQFQWPRGIAVDASGNIWVSDMTLGRVQKFSSTGAFLQTVGSKGSGAGQLGEPAGIDIAPNGDVWVSDWQNDRVSVFSAAGAFLKSIGSFGSGDGQFNDPGEVEIDKLGNVWVGEFGNDRVQQFDLTGQFKAKFGSFAVPAGIAADSKGRLWVADFNSDNVQQWLVPIERPAYISSFGSSGTTDGKLQAPGDVAVGIEGSLWVVDKSNNRIQKFDSTGNFLAKFGSLGSGDGQFNRPTGIAIDRDGNLLVADANNNRVQKFSSDGQFISKFGAPGSGNGQLSNPEGIATDLEGNIWVADSDNGRIQKFDEDGQFLATLGTKGTGSGQLSKPTGIDVDPEGNLWVGDLLNHRVSVFEPDGDFVAQLGTLGTGPGQFTRPSGVEIDSRGNVWVADQSNQRIQRFDLERNYVGQFGSSGSGEGQFSFPTAKSPAGIATDATGALWVTDINNHRIQRWQLGHYLAAPPQPLDLNDGDAKVEIETSGGLVDTAAGAAAGEHTYAHSGDDLTAHDGPEGETKYEYDPAGRMTKVTLPNTTSGQIAYFPDGRVQSVTVDPAGTAPAKETDFEYQDAPSRRTTVLPPDAPHITYDIGKKGDVFKWWNTVKPPTIEPLMGTLYDAREKAAISAGDYYLTARAYSPEGISSIDIFVNGNQVVDEMNCEQDPGKPGLECVSPLPVNEWVMETAEFTPGITWIEVFVTDRIGHTASQRFWVNIPPPPPPSIGAPVPPKFKDIKKFREEYGLEVIFPVANEIELNERIFNLIGAWHNPSSPAGEVARASWERWGVPLRPVDVAELEYREWYVEVNGPRIRAWGEANHPNSYAGYWVDHRAGGLIRVGFTSDQASKVAALAQSGGLAAVDRLRPYESTPAFAFSELISLQLAIGVQDAGQGSLVGQIHRVGLDPRSNMVTVGASNVGGVEADLKSHYGGSAPISVSFDPGTAGPSSAHMTGDGPLKAGHAIAAFLREEADGDKRYNSCTAGPAAWERVAPPKPNGEAKIANFLLTAGHCAEEGKEVFRVESLAGEDAVLSGRIGEQRTRRWQIYQDSSKFETDGEAVRLDGPVPLAARIVGGGTIKGVAPIEIGRTVCESLGFTERVACQPIKEMPEIMPFYANLQYSGPFWQAKVSISTIPGDSGAPVYYPNTREVVGMSVFGSPSQITPLLAPPLPEAGSYPYLKPSRDQAPGLLNEPFMGDLNILKE